jgi:hypothetical protein
MTTLVTVARYHLVQRVIYVVLPLAALAVGFFVDLAIFASVPLGAHHALVSTGHGIPVLVTVHNTSGRVGGGVGAICAWVFIGGLITTARSLPFALALGVSRRAYFAGTALLGAGLAAAYGLLLTVLQAIERATDGWGVSMRVFRLPYFLDGPWYLTWFTATVSLALLFAYGMWYGLVYRRWDLPGLFAFITAQAVVLVAGAMAVTWANSWPGVARFFSGLSAAGLTGVLAGLAIVLATGGYAMVRRATV